MVFFILNPRHLSNYAPVPFLSLAVPVLSLVVPVLSLAVPVLAMVEVGAKLQIPGIKGGLVLINMVTMT